MSNNSDVSSAGYHKCFTCGKWHPAAEAYEGRFCSRVCARAFKRCPVCGEYFQADNFTADGYCSAECAGVAERAKKRRSL